MPTPNQLAALQSEPSGLFFHVVVSEERSCCASQKTPLALATAIAIASTLLIASCGGSDDKPATPPPPSTTPQADTSCQVLANDGSTVVVGSNQPGDLVPASSRRPATARGSSPSTRRPIWCRRRTPMPAAGCAVLKKGGSAAGRRSGRPVRARADRAGSHRHGLEAASCLLTPARAVQAYDGRNRRRLAATENYLSYIDDATNTNLARAERPRQRAVRSAPSASHA